MTNPKSQDLVSRLREVVAWVKRSSPTKWRDEITSDDIEAVSQAADEIERLRNLAERYAVTMPFCPDDTDQEYYTCAECLAQGERMSTVPHETHCVFHRQALSGSTP